MLNLSSLGYGWWHVQEAFACRGCSWWGHSEPNARQHVYGAVDIHWLAAVLIYENNSHFVEGESGKVSAGSCFWTFR